MPPYMFKHNFKCLTDQIWIYFDWLSWTISPSLYLFQYSDKSSHFKCRMSHCWKILAVPPFSIFTWSVITISYTLFLSSSSWQQISLIILRNHNYIHHLLWQTRRVDVRRESPPSWRRRRRITTNNPSEINTTTSSVAAATQNTIAHRQQGWRPCTMRTRR